METSGEVMAVWEFEKPNPREGDSVRVFWFTSVHESVGHFYAFSGIVFIHSRVGAEAYSIWSVTEGRSEVPSTYISYVNCRLFFIQIHNFRSSASKHWAKLVNIRSVCCGWHGRVNVLFDLSVYKFGILLLLVLHHRLCSHTGEEWCRCWTMGVVGLAQSCSIFTALIYVLLMFSWKPETDGVLTCRPWQRMDHMQEY